MVTRTKEAKLDRNIKELVVALNQLPGVTTTASCGGHAKLSGRLNPTDRGTFYVDFVTLPVEGTSSKSLSLIREVIKEYPGKVELEQDTVTIKDKEYLFWSINGKGVAPRVVGYKLLRECQRNGWL